MFYNGIVLSSYAFMTPFDNSLQHLLTKDVFEIKFTPHEKAGVAELADALRSGRSEGSLMWVQVPPSALMETR